MCCLATELKKIWREKVEDSTFLWNEMDWLAEMAQKS